MPTTSSANSQSGPVMKPTNGRRSVNMSREKEYLNDTHSIVQGCQQEQAFR
jgi:hypothetical protein